MKKILTIALSLCVLISVLTVTLAQGTNSQQTPPEQKIEKVKKSIPQELKDKREILKELNKETSNLYLELKSKKSENAGKLKDLHQQLKAAIKERNKEQVSNIMDDIIQQEQGLKAKREDQKNIFGELKAMRDTMKDYTSELKGYIQSKDYSKAEYVLDKMIELRKGINSTLTNVIEIKEQI